MRFVSKISQYDLTCTWTDSNPMVGFIISCPEANHWTSHWISLEHIGTMFFLSEPGSTFTMLNPSWWSIGASPKCWYKKLGVFTWDLKFMKMSTWAHCSWWSPHHWPKSSGEGSKKKTKSRKHEKTQGNYHEMKAKPMDQKKNKIRKGKKERKKERKERKKEKKERKKERKK